ncbi:TatD family hydrolase [Endozoicomonadaceae bacterium StTr2]
MIIDSHCHLDRLGPDISDEQLDEIVAAADKAGVNAMLCAGVTLEAFPGLLRVVERYDNVVGAVGVHPLEDEGCKEPEVESLVQMSAHPKIVAIGETGLDFYYKPDSEGMQLKRFETQLQAAKQAQLPVIIHSRQAQQQTVDMIRALKPEAGGVLHCFTEGEEMARQVLDEGLYISISGIVTFRNAAALRDVVKMIPLDRLLVETDSPYLAPVPHRGKPNRPEHTAVVARYIAELKGVSLEQIAEQTTANFFSLFPKARDTLKLAE